MRYRTYMRKKAELLTYTALGGGLVAVGLTVALMNAYNPFGYVGLFLFALGCIDLVIVMNLRSKLDWRRKERRTVWVGTR